MCACYSTTLQPPDNCVVGPYKRHKKVSLKMSTMYNVVFAVITMEL